MNGCGRGVAQRWRMRVTVALLCAGLTFLIPSFADAQSGPRNCTRTSQNLFVRDVLDEYYLWYRELPRVNPSNYASPEAYLEAVRYRPLDNTFSYITSRAANDAFYGESQFVGFGFSTQTGQTTLDVLQVFPESPASEAGMSRGDRIIEINGRSVADLIRAGTIGSAFGANAEGVSAAVAVRSREGVERRFTMTKRVVTIPTVSLTRTFLVDGRTVGYLLFRNFVNPSYAALDDAFAALRDARVLYLNYPHNPTGAVATRDFYAEAVAFCRRHGLALVSDLAYSEITFDGYRAPSVLEVPGARDVAIEFHTLSKSFNMAGSRVGFAVGNAALSSELGVRQQTVSEWETGLYQPRGASARLLTLVAERAGFRYGDEPAEPRP